MSTTKLAKPVAHWLKVCQSHIRESHIKRADLGGDGQSVPFEQALSNLAHAYLKDRAPQLLDHELGFQLVEKNEDNDRAIGIFGFRVGSQLLYAPVFFLNGELKGNELLYLKDSDTFVPMKENWINYVLNRKPNVIGEEVQPNLGSIGVERPDMDMFRESPGKYGSDRGAMPDWLAPAMPGLMYALGRYEANGLHVPELVKENADAATKFLQYMSAFPSLAEPIVQVYGKDLVHEAIKTARTADSCSPRGSRKRRKKKYLTGSVYKEKSAAEQARERINDNLRIWIFDDTTDVRARNCSKGLNEKQAQELKRDGVYVSDERTDDDVSHAYKVQEPLSLMNPDDTGVYEVLCKPDTFRRCLYIHSPHNARGTKPNGVIVSLEDGNKAWTETHPGSIFISDEYDGETFRDYFDKLPETTSLEVGATYVVVAQNGQGTSVFEVEKSLPAEGDEKCYEVYWRNRYYRRPDHLPPIAEHRYEYDSDCEGADTLTLNRIKGPRFVVRQCCVYTPDGAKAIKLKGPPEEKDDDCCRPICCSTDSGDSSDPPAIRPGNLVDLQVGIYKTSEELRVFNNGTEAIVDGNRMTPLHALVHLVRDYGLREKTAKELLKEAQLKRGIKCRVKVAQPYQALGYPPSAPSFPDSRMDMGTDGFLGSGLPTQHNYPNDELLQQVEGMQGAGSDPLMSPPPEGMDGMMVGQELANAAQTGQKEVLDTSLLSNLLKGTQNETLIDKHLSNLMKGLDSLGRLLFNMYWHHDKFEDRYGGNNLPEMTDAMKNAYEALGDVTLELKQNTVEPYPDEGVDPSFGEGEM